MNPQASELKEKQKDKSLGDSRCLCSHGQPQPGDSGPGEGLETSTVDGVRLEWRNG